MKNNDQNGDGKVVYHALEIAGTVYETLLTTKYLNKKPYQQPDAKLLHSLLPGTIIKVEVKKGDKIKAGQTLLVFEAMKMLNTVKSKQNCIVKEIFVKPGDKISKNFLMLAFE